MKINRFILFATLFFVAACTDFREEEMPVSFGVDETELAFPEYASTRSVTVSSGTKWDITSMPNWITLPSIYRNGHSPYEWIVDFNAAANDGYDREGTIRIKAGSDAADISVTQAGKKGKYIAVESVSLSPTELTLTEEEYASLTYTITPSNASIKDVTWKSSSPSVATVAQSGRVDAISEGTALITLTTEDGKKTASCAVTVKAKVIPVTGVSLDKTTLSMNEGDVQALTATVSPTNATDKSVTWSSNNTAVATVSSSGIVTAKTAGTATITVKTNDGAKTASCVVTVIARVTGVSLDRTTLSLNEGETATLKATVSPSNASDKSVTWTSSNTSVATVSSSGIVTAKTAGSATITVKTNDGGKTATCTVTVIAKVTGVSLDKTSLSLTEGETATLKATITPSNATDKSVTWTSSNTSIATVSSDGVVTAKTVGSATITVKTNDGGKTATCPVTVKAKTVSVTSVSLDKTSLSMTEGDTQTLTATVSPSNASNKSVTWSSSNTTVASVSSSGVVTAKAAGSATITVTTNDGGKTATCSVTVNAKTISVTGVSLDKTSLTLTEDDTYTLTATVSPSNATDKSITWSSNNTSVATVSSSGVVTAKAAGTAKITVTTNDGGKTATCSVTVQAKKISVTGVSLNKTSLSMTEGDTQTLTATVTPSNATDKSVTWSSSNSSVATVSSSGVVTAKAAGSATITVKTNDGGKTATCSVTVQAKTVAVTGVSLNKTTLSMTVGDTQTLTATITPSNATDKSVTWSSSNTSVATVSSSGVVTAKSAGNVTITVTTNDGAKTATCSVTVNEKTVSVTGVTLDKTSLSLTEGDTYSLTATVIPSNATDKSVTWSSSNTSVATVSSSGVVTAKSTGSATITVKTNDGAKTATCAVAVKAATIVVPEAIDLGLSVKWASFNLGASRPEGYGNYYAWGETEPKDYYYWSDYKWCKGSSTTLTKYCDNSEYGNNGFTDTKTVLDPEDDAAHVNLGGRWRMPTDAEWTELMNNCKCIMANQNGVMGYLVTASNGNSIFLPGAGQWSFGHTLNSGGFTCDYWSSSLTTNYPFDACRMDSGTDGVRMNRTDRCYGLSVRPVYADGSAVVHVTSVSLDKTTLSLTEGDTQTLTATVSPSNASNKSVTWSSSNTTVASVSSSGVVTAKAAGSATITVTTNDGGKTATCSVTVQGATTGTENGHDWVDLGLPSGLKWATCNVGASKPEEYGDYFAWGETEPKTNTGYNWSTYKWCRGSESTLTKYNSKSTDGTVDNRTTLDPEDDAARVNLGGAWRMPTEAEWAELQQNCTWTWTNDYNGTGVSGRIVTSKITGYKNKSIFLPAAGLRYDTYLNSTGSYGYYWSSSLSADYPSLAWSVFFNSGNVSRGSDSRDFGQSVRPVTE